MGAEAPDAHLDAHSNHFLSLRRANGEAGEPSVTHGVTAHKFTTARTPDHRSPPRATQREHTTHLAPAPRASGSMRGLEERREAEEAPESPATDDDEAPATKQGRRDKRGRFEADPWQSRVLEWSQLARGVPPTTINRVDLRQVKTFTFTVAGIVVIIDHSNIGSLF